MSQTEVVSNWTEEYAAELGRCIRLALKTVEADYALRVPRSEEDRRDGFAPWIAQWKERWLPQMEAALQNAAPPLHFVTTPEAVERCVWSSVENWLRIFALRGLASGWASHHLWDSATLGMPERNGEYWRIPIGLRGLGDNLGQIVLDNNGNILTHLTTTRSQIQERIDDRAVPSSSSAA